MLNNASITGVIYSQLRMEGDFIDEYVEVGACTDLVVYCFCWLNEN
jgi:hypothetical protein